MQAPNGLTGSYLQALPQQTALGWRWHWVEAVGQLRGLGAEPGSGPGTWDWPLSHAELMLGVRAGVRAEADAQAELKLEAVVVGPGVKVPAGPLRRLELCMAWGPGDHQ